MLSAEEVVVHERLRSCSIASLRYPAVVQLPSLVNIESIMNAQHSLEFCDRHHESWQHAPLPAHPQLPSSPARILYLLIPTNTSYISVHMYRC
jgi:hypothetical protein